MVTKLQLQEYVLHVSYQQNESTQINMCYLGDLI